MAISQSAAERIKTAQDQVSGTFMPQKVRIALDAMGGDVGAAVVIPGAAISLTRHPDTEFLLFGERGLIEAELAKHPAMKAASRVIHTDVAVSMHDKPSQALRRGRKTSSMWLAIDAVKKGEADVAISAGNTGALMAMGRFCLRMLPGIERPAIAAIWPTARGDSVILDVGATIGGDAQHLKTLALMGGAMASVLVATRTFFEGFDVPGESLSLLVLDRLPFPRPDEPLLSIHRQLKATFDPAGIFNQRRMFADF